MTLSTRSKTLMQVWKEAASDAAISDSQFRNLVRYLAGDPIDAADLARTRELADRFGWARSR